MPVGTAPGRTKLEIRADRLLLVEGRDEVNLFEAFIRHSLVDGPDIQVIDVGGKDKTFRRNLKAIQIASLAVPTLRAIGVVRDADCNARGAFESICSGIRSANYEPPESHGEFSHSVPAIVWGRFASTFLSGNIGFGRSEQGGDAVGHAQGGWRPRIGPRQARV